MRSRAPLALMEQMVMLLVFALAAALCLRVFATSDKLSGEGEDRDQAALLCQNAAEVIRHHGGDMGEALSGAAEDLEAAYAQGLLWLDYDENWSPIDYNTCGMGAPEAAYRLTAQGVPTETEGLLLAKVAVTAGDRALFSLEIAWQGEVSAGE